jgi:uncharacterized protein YbcI
MRVCGDTEIQIVADLILLRCRKAVSPSEIELGGMKVGRLLVQEASERMCRRFQPELGRLLYESTESRLVDICVGTSFERREGIYIFAMSGKVKTWRPKTRGRHAR